MGVDETLFEEIMRSMKLSRNLLAARVNDAEDISKALTYKLSHHFDPENDMEEGLRDLLEVIGDHTKKSLIEVLGEAYDRQAFELAIKGVPGFEEKVKLGLRAKNSVVKLKKYMEDNDVGDEAKEFAALCINAFTDINSMLLEQDVVPLIKRGIYSEDLADAISVWEMSAVEKATDESFWQTELEARKGILERLLGGFAVFLQREFHVGSTNSEGAGSKRADFALVDSINNNISLIEIKTPSTKLLGTEYRSTYPFSSEMSGTISQVLNQRNELTLNFFGKAYSSPKTFEVFAPKCFIIAGTLKSLGEDKIKLKAFEMQRQAVASHVTIVTFDELYHQFSMFNQI